MSIKVDVSELAAAIAERGGAAFVCTVSDPPVTHLTHTTVHVEGDGADVALRCAVGRTSRANAAERTAVVLLWPSRTPDDYSLIVDGEAHADGEELVIEPTSGVLHRPAGA